MKNDHHTRKAFALSILAVCCILLAQPSMSQEVIQSKGVSADLRYDSLKNFGPWDDRNYQLSRADLQFLAPNESELKDPIPVFFRIQLRKNYPNLQKEGPAQYPRSALQIYQQLYGGYLVGNNLSHINPEL